MAESTARKHTIDILFPWALFGLLAICGLLVLILAADIYQDTTTMADENYESRTVLSYLTEKIHQNDNGTVTIGSVDGEQTVLSSVRIMMEKNIAPIFLKRMAC